MTYRRPGRLAVLLVAIAVAALVCDQLLASSSSTVPPRVRVADGETDARRAPVPADSAVPGGTTAFDAGIPGVAKLDPALLAALRRATTDAATEGVALFVHSGWRSAEYQQQLREDAVAKYGSAEEAARWVAAPDQSAHVSGDAVDIGPAAATAWLARRGAAYGLCQVYANEPWHYELRPRASVEGCPPTYTDPTHDPRRR